MASARSGRHPASPTGRTAAFGHREECPGLSWTAAVLAKAAVGVSSAALAWAALRHVADLRDTKPAQLLGLVFVQDAVRSLLGSASSSPPSAHAAGRYYEFEEDKSRGSRAVLSVTLWVPLFSGAMYSAARLFFQVNNRDTVFSARRSGRRPRRSSRSSVTSSHQTAPTPPPAQPLVGPQSDFVACSDSSLGTERRLDLEAELSPSSSSAPPPQQQQQQQVSGGDNGAHPSRASGAIKADAQPKGARSSQLLATPPKQRAPAPPLNLSSLRGDGSAPRPQRVNPVHSALRDGTQRSAGGRRTVTVSDPGTTPRLAALRTPDTVTLATASPCTLLEVNAMLTAAAKYVARQVVVPHGSAKPDSASTTTTLTGSTPRTGSGTPVMTDNDTAMAHVTSRTLEFVGRFQRTVQLAEIEDSVSLVDFLRANRAKLSPEEGEDDAPVVTVAVHSRPVPGATYLRDFVHPKNAVYCFVKDAGSPVKRIPAGGNSTTATNGSDAAGVANFMSPLNLYRASGETHEAHFEATRDRTAVSSGQSTPSTVDSDVTFCDYHVYLRSDARYQPLAGMVNVVLYDRAGKRRRDEALPEEDDRDGVGEEEHGERAA